MHGLYITLVILLSVGVSRAADESLISTDLVSENSPDNLVEDALILAPPIVTVKPHREKEWVTINWGMIAEATAYQIWREISVSHAKDTSEDVVQLNTLEKAWVPWAQIEHVPGEDMASAIVATLDPVSTRWGVSTIIARDGIKYTSPIQAVEASPTLVQGVSWSEVKSSRIP